MTLKPLPTSSSPGTAIDNCTLLLMDESNSATAQLKTININSSEHYIGELYGGGIVAMVWKVDGKEHGLIASLINIVPAPLAPIGWNGNSINVPTGARGANYGLENRNIVSTKPLLRPGGAFKLCDSYSAGSGVGGVWYLPSNDELNACFNALPILQTVLAGVPGAEPFTGYFYWSSTEYSATEACMIDMGNGSITKNAKWNNYLVRAVKRY